MSHPVIARRGRRVGAPWAGALCVTLATLVVAGCPGPDAPPPSTPTPAKPGNPADGAFSEAPLEQIGEAELGSPRLQFACEAPGESEALWSVDLDGSQLRRVLTPEQLSPDGVSRKRLMAASRSPGGRYVMLHQMHKDNRLLRVIDLTDRSSHAVSTDAHQGYWEAGRDDQSARLLYSNPNDPKLWSYDPASKESTHLVAFDAVANHSITLPLPNGRLCVMLDDGYMLYGADGTLEQRVTVGKPLRFSKPTLSAHGDLIHYLKGGDCRSG